MKQQLFRILTELFIDFKFIESKNRDVEDDAIMMIGKLSPYQISFNPTDTKFFCMLCTETSETEITCEMFNSPKLLKAKLQSLLSE